jgi:hypothetical protein
MTRGSKRIMPCTTSASIRGKAENVATLVPFVIRFLGDGLCASIFISTFTNNALSASSDNPHK